MSSGCLLTSWWFQGKRLCLRPPGSLTLCESNGTFVVATQLRHTMGRPIEVKRDESLLPFASACVGRGEGGRRSVSVSVWFVCVFVWVGGWVQACTYVQLIRFLTATGRWRRTLCLNQHQDEEKGWGEDHLIPRFPRFWKYQPFPSLKRKLASDSET